MSTTDDLAAAFRAAGEQAAAQVRAEAARRDDPEAATKRNGELFASFLEGVLTRSSTENFLADPDQETH